MPELPPAPGPLRDGRGNIYTGSRPFHDHPFLFGEPISGVVTMPDDSMRPLYRPGSLVFYARAKGLLDRVLVFRLRGALTIRHVWWKPNGLYITGDGDGYRKDESGVIELDHPPGWRRSGPYDLHPDVEILGRAVTCTATYTAIVCAAIASEKFGARMNDAETARALYGEDGMRDPTRNDRGRALPALFAGSAN